MVKRGEVWLCTFDPVVGREIMKTQPGVIVSPDDLNKRLATVIIAPLTTGSHPTRFRVPVKFQGKDGQILPEQIRAVDRQRLVKRLGALDAATTLTVLQEMFSE